MLIVVLNDQETWTSLKGCPLMLVTEDGLDSLQRGTHTWQLNENQVVVEHDLNELVGKATAQSIVKMTNKEESNEVQ